MRKSRFLAGLAAIAIGAAGVPAQAQTNVPVTLSNPAGSRVMYVENVNGSTLTALEFGTSRSLPFRVRVVDNQFDREGFTVSATMTNLYGLDEVGEVDYNLDRIDSADVRLGSVASPSALDVSAVVQPIIDTVTTLTDPVICNLLGFTPLNLTDGCSFSTADVVGKATSLTLPADVLAQLPKLPLIPQPVAAGPFTNPEHGVGTVGAGDPDKSVLTPTSRQVLAGDAAPVDLSALQSLLDTLVAGADDSALIDSTALLTKIGETLPISSLLPDQVATLVASTQATVDALTLGNILSQTGTYVSLPTLNVSTDNAAAGSYKGTLVVTALQ
jgi:hypothetical protein